MDNTHKRNNIKHITQNKIKDVKHLLKEHLKQSHAKNQFAIFGNAYTDEEEYVGVGLGQGSTDCSKNKKITGDMYIRLASTTKLIGALAMAKAFEDGLITDIDGSVADYCPEFHKDRLTVIDKLYAVRSCNGFLGVPKYLKFVSSIDAEEWKNTHSITKAGAVMLWNLKYYIINKEFSINGDGNIPLNDSDNNPIFLADPVDEYDPRTATSLNESALEYVFIYTTKPCTIQMTIRHLLAMQSGLGYAWHVLSNSINSLVSAAAYPAGQKYIGLLQKVKRDNVNNKDDAFDMLVAPYYNHQYSQTDIIRLRLNYPLLCQPGQDTMYGCEPSIFGAVISGAIKKFKHNIQSIPSKIELKNYFIKKNISTSVDYLQHALFTPLHIHNIWFSAGSSTPPNDVNEKLITAFFVGDDKDPDHIGSNQAPNNTASWCTDYPNTGFYTFQKYSACSIHDPYAGGYDAGGATTPHQYCKLLKLIINKGVYKGKQIIGRHAINYILTPQLSPTNNGVNPDLKNNGVFNTGKSILWSFGNPNLEMNGVTMVNRIDNKQLYLPYPNPNNLTIGTLSLLLPDYGSWCCGFSKLNNDGLSTIRYPNSYSTYSWDGIYGTTYIFDIDTGYYIYSGTQCWSNGISTAPVPFQIDCFKLFSAII